MENGTLPIEAETSEALDAQATGGHTRSEATRPLTITLPDTALKKLKIIAIVRGASVSELVADAALGVVKRELKKAVSKISGD